MGSISPTKATSVLKGQLSLSTFLLYIGQTNCLSKHKLVLGHGNIFLAAQNVLGFFGLTSASGSRTK